MGILGTFKDSVTLVNRTNRTLNVRFDGEDISIAPGDNPGFPKIAVPYAKKQNPLNGSKHPIDPRKYISLVGVKGTKDDVTKISVATLAAADAKPELMDRDGEHWGEPMAKVKLLRKAPHSAYEAAVELPGDFDVNPNIQ